MSGLLERLQRMNGWQVAVYGLVLSAGVCLVAELPKAAGSFGIAAAGVTAVYLLRRKAKREDAVLGWPVVVVTAGLGVVLLLLT